MSNLSLPTSADDSLDSEKERVGLVMDARALDFPVALLDRNCTGVLGVLEAHREVLFISIILLGSWRDAADSHVRVSNYIYSLQQPHL